MNINIINYTYCYGFLQSKKKLKCRTKQYEKRKTHPKLRLVSPLTLHTVILIILQPNIIAYKVKTNNGIDSTCFAFQSKKVKFACISTSTSRLIH